MQYRKHHIFIILLAIIVFTLPVSAQCVGNEDGSATVSTASNIESAKPEKRIFGVLPNYRTVDASIPFVPLTPRQKLGIAARDSFDWPTFPTAAVMTFAMPGKDEAKDYGTGLAVFANRYARNVSDQIVGNMLTEGFLPVVLHQDPRYFRLGSGSFASRLRSSLVQIMVARNDANQRTFNTAEFLGNAMATGISNTYSPNLHTWQASTEKLGLMVGTDMFSNVVKEFGPDIKEHLLHRHHKGT